MPKAIIKYDLSIPDDVIDFKRANKATDMAIVLWELQHNLKREFEGSEEHNNETLDIVFQRICELIDDHNINVDELIC
jgi:hypothetical protein